MYADRIRLPLRFDALLLQGDLDRLATADWIGHFFERNYEGQWDVLPLRGPQGAQHPVQMIYSDPNCTQFADTPFLDGLPEFQNVLNSFECPLESIRLMRLSSGSRIKEHTDYDLDIDQGTARLHVPVTTHPDIDFQLNGRRVRLAAGECWYLRLADPHAVENPSPIDRIHLGLDVNVNDWLLSQLESGHSPATS